MDIHSKPNARVRIPDEIRRVGILRRPDTMQPDDLKPYSNLGCSALYQSPDNTDHSLHTVADLELTVPTTVLRSSPKKVHTKSMDHSHETTATKTKVNLSYWLKPTPVQVYPYHFFIAACKKLEAITNPVARGKTDIVSNDRKSSSVQRGPEFHSKINKVDRATQQSARLNQVIRHNTSSASTESDLLDPKSVSLSTKTGTVINDFDEDSVSVTSKFMSSRTDSLSNQLSLSTASVDSLKIASNAAKCSGSDIQHAIEVHPFINSKRGSEEIGHQLDLNKTNALEMLEVFNKGLSQAISDSRKLHQALCSSSYLVPKSSDPASDHAYSMTFESVTDNSNNDPANTVTASKSSASNINTENESSVANTWTSKRVEKSFSESALEQDANTLCRQIEFERQQTSSGTDIQTDYDTDNESTFAKQQVIKNINQSQHVNFSRGSSPNELVGTAAAAANTLNAHNQSIGSDIYAMLNQTGSMLIDSYSESTVSYSRLGLYDCLINGENQKSKDLTTLLKLREKSLIDRTKGQIAWLELHKKKYKEKGLTAQISAVKKKQRAILVSLDKERACIHRTVKSQQNDGILPSGPSMRLNGKHFSTALLRTERLDRCSTSLPHQAIKGHHISVRPGTDIEVMLQKREKELQKRRAHVEHLISWHQRLDDEEKAVRHMENQLMDYSKSKSMETAAPAPLRVNDLPAKQEQQIQNIERSIHILQNLSNDSGDKMHQETDEVCVHASGAKMNKLWRRLTGENSEKFDAQKRFKFSKSDLENIYEEAKRTVVMRFSADGCSSIVKELEDSKVQSDTSIRDNTAIVDQSMSSSDPLRPIDEKGPNEPANYQATVQEDNVSDVTSNLCSILIETGTDENICDSLAVPNPLAECSHVTDIDDKTTNTVVNLPDEIYKIHSPIEMVKEKNLEQRLIDLDDSLKDVNEVMERSLCSESSKSSSVLNSSNSTDDIKVQPRPVEKSKPLYASGSIKLDTENRSPGTVAVSTANKMPDIISEAEVLRCQLQVQPSELQKIETRQTVINKPPPPYVPPAHGSPLTTIFPSEDRIVDVVFRRMKELSCDGETPSTQTTTKLCDENITNIFERIVLDICEECIHDMPSAPVYVPTAYKQLDKYKHPLAFYNPPNRLACIQAHVLKRVRKLLGNYPYNSVNLYRPLAIRTSTGHNKSKHDSVDEILVQEISEDDALWTNFDVEKSEVLTAITSEILSMELANALQDCQTNWSRRKLSAYVNKGAS